MTDGSRKGRSSGETFSDCFNHIARAAFLCVRRQRVLAFRLEGRRNERILRPARKVETHTARPIFGTAGFADIALVWYKGRDRARRQQHEALAFKFDTVMPISTLVRTEPHATLFLQLVLDNSDPAPSSVIVNRCPSAWLPYKPVERHAVLLVIVDEVASIAVWIKSVMLWTKVLVSRIDECGHHRYNII